MSFNLSKLTDEELKEAKATFEMLTQKNETGDIAISVAQLKTLIDPEKVGKLYMSEIDDIINEVEADGNGTIELPEFLEMMADKIQSTDQTQEMKQAFDYFKDSKTSKISKANFKQGLKIIALNLEDKDIDEIFDEADGDRDGELDEQEFMNFLKSK